MIIIQCSRKRYEQWRTRRKYAFIFDINSDIWRGIEDDCAQGRKITAQFHIKENGKENVITEVAEMELTYGQIALNYIFNKQ